MVAAELCGPLFASPRARKGLSSLSMSCKGLRAAVLPALFAYVRMSISTPTLASAVRSADKKMRHVLGLAKEIVVDTRVELGAGNLRILSKNPSEMGDLLDYAPGVRRVAVVMRFNVRTDSFGKEFFYRPLADCGARRTSMGGSTWLLLRGYARPVLNVFEALLSSARPEDLAKHVPHLLCSLTRVRHLTMTGIVLRSDDDEVGLRLSELPGNALPEMVSLVGHEWLVRAVLTSRDRDSQSLRHIWVVSFTSDPDDLEVAPWFHAGAGRHLETIRVTDGRQCRVEQWSRWAELGLLPPNLGTLHLHSSWYPCIYRVEQDYTCTMVRAAQALASLPRFLPSLREVRIGRAATDHGDVLEKEQQRECRREWSAACESVVTEYNSALAEVGRAPGSCSVGLFDWGDASIFDSHAAAVHAGAVGERSGGR